MPRICCVEAIKMNIQHPNSNIEQLFNWGRPEPALCHLLYASVPSKTSARAVAAVYDRRKYATLTERRYINTITHITNGPRGSPA
jgi:hypothetical protein